VHVLVADLHKDRAAAGQQVAGDGQAVAQIGQVGVNAVLSGVAERLDLLGLAADVGLSPVFHVTGPDLPS